MPGKPDEKIKFLCVKFKPNESPDKVKSKILKSLKRAEKSAPFTISNPLDTWSNKVHCIDELNATEIADVSTNSKYVVFLLKDGRVCRMKCTSTSSNEVPPSAVLKPTPHPTFQLLSDAEYARQLQSQFNTERGERPTTSTLNLTDLNRFSRELMYVGSIPSPVYHQDPEYYQNLAREFSRQEELVTGLGSSSLRSQPSFRATSPPRPTWDPFSSFGGISPPSEYESMTTRIAAASGQSQPSNTSGPHDRGGVGMLGLGRQKLVETETERVPWPVMGTLEWPVTKQNPDDPSPDSKFVAMATIHSEILLVSANGHRLYSWACDKATCSPHPLMDELGLSSERITLLASSDVRVTMVTESGKVATFYDALLRDCSDNGVPPLILSLSHPVLELPELTEPIKSLSVSNFITTAVTESGKVYWWGLCPQGRNKASNHSIHSGSTSRDAITDGSFVRLKNGPPCGANAVVYKKSHSHGACVGRTVNIMEHSGLDPKTSVLVKVLKEKSNQRYIDVPHQVPESGLEVWKLSDVVFLDDSPSILGRVVTVDQHQAIVDVSHSQDSQTAEASKSCLKVFKVSELELCVDVKTGEKSKAKTKRCSVLQPPLSRGITHHVAGIVQHKPVCLLNPSQAEQTNSTFGTYDDTPASTIFGYKPLAIQATDEGINLLVERMTDGKAFLVCSAHASTGAFISTSFIAIGGKDGKPSRCTIKEESVNATESGLAANNFDLLPKSRASGGEREDNQEGDPKPQIGIKRKHTPPSPRSSTPTEAFTSDFPLSATHPTFISCYNSRVLLLQDVNGLVWPLMDGLSLKPGHPKHLRSSLQPLQAYRSIVSRQHSSSKDTNVMVLILVPRPRVLIPAVISGDVAKVESILTHLSITQCPPGDGYIRDSLPSKNRFNSKDPSTSNSRSYSPLSPDEEMTEVSQTSDEQGHRDPFGIATDEPLVKRPKLSEPPHSQRETLFSNVEELAKSAFPVFRPTAEYSLSSPTADQVLKIDFDSEMEVLEKRTPCVTTSVEMDEVQYGVEVLLEATVRNSNLLHVCCQLESACGVTKSDGLELTKTTEVFTPHKVDHMKYQSITCLPEHRQNSFEELRHQYQCQPGGGAQTLSRGGLNNRRMAILDLILECKEIRPIVLKMLCSQNAEGRTPFMVAINQRNYAGALKILEFAEGIRGEQESTCSRSNGLGHTSNNSRDLHNASLLDKVIFTTKNGVTSIQSLFASLSPHYDSEAMCLHISSIPVNYTAQQLLKLFQGRYPSAYKAEVLKLDDIGTSSSSESGSGSSDNEDEAMVQESGDLIGRVPQPYSARSRSRLGMRRRTRRRNANSFFGSANSTLPRNGVVYFSDVTHLRAAAKEMHNYRVTQTLSRSTGFGQTQSISFLNIHLEASSESENEATDDFPTVFPSFVRNLPVELGVLRMDPRVPVGKNTRKEAFRKSQCDDKFSSPVLAHQLLLKLLSHTNGATAVDSVGETALASLVHNPRCLASLNELRSGTQKKSEPETAGHGLSSLAEFLRNKQSLAGSQRAEGTGGASNHLLDYICPEFSSEEDTPVVPSRNIRRKPDSPHPKHESSPVRSSFTTNIRDNSVLPSVMFSGVDSSSLASQIFNATSLFATTAGGGSSTSEARLTQVVSSTKPPDTNLAPMVTSTDAISLLFCANGGQGSLVVPDIPPPECNPLHSKCSFNGSAVDCGSGIRLAFGMEKGHPCGSGIEKGHPDTSIGSSGIGIGHPSSSGIGIGHPGTSGIGIGHPGSSGIGIGHPGVGIGRSEMAGIGQFETEQRPDDTHKEVQSEIPNTQSSKLCDPPSHQNLPQSRSEPSAESDKCGCNMLNAMATNWPCIVATILGFYPDDKQPTNPNDVGASSKPQRLSPVHLLDSFTSDLILNCEEPIVNTLVATIVKHMNSALADGTSKLSLEKIDFSKIDSSSVDQSSIALIVGKRFLNSVVRVLALEHSRVKNTTMELQQMRMNESGQPQRARRRKNVAAIAKSILGSFSWLAVQSLANSAEASVTPVRLGIAKPQGANSVSSDYTPQRPVAQSYRNTRNEDPNQALARQMHVRFALPVSEADTGATFNGASILPVEGVALRPVAKESDLNISQDSSKSIESMPEDDSSDEDFSDHDIIEGSRRRDGEFGLLVAQAAGVRFAVRDPPLAIRLADAVRESEIVLDLDPTSSEEDEFSFEDQLVDRGLTFTPNAEPRGEEGNLVEEMYPFAWALDGRRVGETIVSSNRPNSPSSFVFGGPPEPPPALGSIPSIRFGAGFLARTFSRFVKDLVDIAKMICDNKTTQPCLMLPPSASHHMIKSTVSTLEQTWQWIVTILDVAEGQLLQGQFYDTQRYVISLRGGVQNAHTRPVVRIPSRVFPGSTPGEYVTYLLRTQSHEHDQCMPVIDLYGYEHVVFLLDGLIYTLANWPKAATLLANQSDSPEMTSSATNQNAEHSKHNPEPTIADKAQEKVVETSKFFERTESIIIGEEDDSHTLKSNEQFFGKEPSAFDRTHFVGPPSPWGAQIGGLSQSLHEAYPLAQQPHLLRPHARKEHLFSSPGGSRRGSGMSDEGARKLPVSYAQQSSSTHPSPITLTWTLDQALQRWHNSISVFAHIFLAEGPGSERSNFLNARAGFASRMARFRHQVSQLYETSVAIRDWASTVSSTFNVRVRRQHLLQDAIESLQQMVRYHYSQIRVKFEGEDGSGPGVNRGFFASLANEVKSNDLTKPPMNKLGVLFSEPGKHPEQSGFYAPCPFVLPSTNTITKNATIKVQRKNAFRAIGRFLGLCLWFRFTIPFMVCRHVAKYLLGRDIAWHDLAFYNADLYEGLRRMMLDVEHGKKSKEEFMATYCCYFEVPLGQSPVLVDLIPGGSKIPVTPERVQEYVRLYSMFMMVECVKEELQGMKEGMTDVIPHDLLSGLTAEDFQLLMSGGSANITLTRLKSVIRFNHTHDNSANVCDRFEKMFWRVVSHMNNIQRQQLLYFATGSAALPATTDNNDSGPGLSITIDVIGSSNTQSLPVASTCSQRMSIPLYPSYHLLKKKLLQAIQCQAYGLG